MCFGHHLEETWIRAQKPGDVLKLQSHWLKQIKKKKEQLKQNKNFLFGVIQFKLT